MSSPKRSMSMSSPDDEGPSPKRQRRSPSPSSPPTTAKASSAHPLQTPSPSVHMSPEWSAQQLPGLGLSAHAANGSATFPTPPLTAGFHGQMVTSALSSDGGSQTPAHDAGNLHTDDTGGDIAMEDAERRQNPLGDDDEDMNEATDSDNRRSDHERQRDASSMPGADILYHLRTAPIPLTNPRYHQNLIQLYSLEPLQASVARVDPASGVKINKMRKSYEGKLKEFGYEGRNKPTVSNAILEGLVDPGWDMQDGEGKALWDTSDLCDPPLLGHDGAAGAIGRIEGLLGRALDFRPGELPEEEHKEWKSLLGLDEAAFQAPPAKATAPAASPAATITEQKSAATALLTKTAPATAPRGSNPSSPHSNSGIRPERVGKKRRYDEASYAGYQEGYDDDGYSTGGIDDASGRRGNGGPKRQKRKDFPSSSNSPPFATTSGPVAMRSS